MKWKNLKEHVYYEDGSLRDLCVVDTCCSDWQKWVEYANKNYDLRWFNGKENRTENHIDFGVIEALWNREHDLCSSASIFIGKIQINVHFFEDTEMEMDLDPREFQSIEEHHQVVEFMSNLAKLLKKEVRITPESEHHVVLFKVD